MWPICDFSLASALWLLGPLILGLLTAWWIWGGSHGTDAGDGYVEPETLRTAPPTGPLSVPTGGTTPTPGIAPVPDVEVEPVRFSAPQPEPAVFTAPPVAAAPMAAAAIGLTAIGIPAAVGSADDLLQIKGVGPKLNALLIDLGVRRFDQIAAWGASEIDKVDDHLGAFKGRIDRDQWIEQAGLLARGAIAEFEAKFGKLDSENQ
jgi:predicted flap endonuclease-1-like 5' DNA nuclease